VAWSSTSAAAKVDVRVRASSANRAWSIARPDRYRTAAHVQDRGQASTGPADVHGDRVVLQGGRCRGT